MRAPSGRRIKARERTEIDRTILNNDVGTDHHVGTDVSRRGDLGAWVLQEQILFTVSTKKADYDHDVAVHRAGFKVNKLVWLFAPQEV